MSNNTKKGITRLSIQDHTTGKEFSYQTPNKKSLLSFVYSREEGSTGVLCINLITGAEKDQWEAVARLGNHSIVDIGYSNFEGFEETEPKTESNLKKAE